MAKTLNDEQQKNIKKAIFKKADEYGYLACGRVQSGQFMDELVDDPEVGGVLKEYMSKERVRTYIKDGVLNAYSKEKNKEILSSINPESTIKRLFQYEAAIIQHCSGKYRDVFVLRSTEGLIFVVSGGTTIKWETALRKALDIIANESGLTIEGKTPYIALQLTDTSQEMTAADRNHIENALAAIGVKVLFFGIN